MKRISVELTRGDVFEISAYVSPNSHGLPNRPVLICPDEVVEAEDPGHEELDESMPEPDVVPRGVAVPETPSDKDRDAHISPRSRGAACVFEAKELTNGISQNSR